MINTKNIRTTVVKGLRDLLKCPVIRRNQNAPMPDYPYLGYTITTPMTANNGTYQEHDDGIARKAVKQIWSITAFSDDFDEALSLANIAHAWLDYQGTVLLNDNGVIVESVGNVADRSNLITVDYQYSYGFDCTFWVYDEIEMAETETIEVVEINEIRVEAEPTVEELTDKLNKRLDGEVVE